MLVILNVRGPKGMATDGADKLYMAGPSIPAGCPPTCPAPGTLKTSVDVFSVSTGDVVPFTSQGVFADGSLDAYDLVDSLTVDPTGNVYVADDPNAAPPPNGQGRIFKVPAATQEPVPAIVTKPNNPTNQTNPTFGIQDADPAAKFRCSLVPIGSPDSFAGCTSPVTYGATAAGSTTAVIVSGQTTEVEFTNIRIVVLSQAYIQVCKETGGGAAGTFSFTSPAILGAPTGGFPGTQTITVVAGASQPVCGPLTLASLANGQIAITEAPTAGFAFAGVRSSPSVPFVLSGTTATFTIPAGVGTTRETQVQLIFRNNRT
jgi:hypothetical protein